MNQDSGKSWYTSKWILVSSFHGRRKLVWIKKGFLLEDQESFSVICFGLYFTPGTLIEVVNLATFHSGFYPARRRRAYTGKKIGCIEMRRQIKYIRRQHKVATRQWLQNTYSSSKPEDYCPSQLHPLTNTVLTPWKKCQHLENPLENCSNAVQNQFGI